MPKFDEAAKKKRMIIMSIYIIVFCLFILAIYLLRKPAATCFDHIQNEGESGIDCGGPCGVCADVSASKDLQVTEKAFAPGGNNTFDVVANITNPNDSVGASSFDYTFTLLDQNGKTIGTKSGTSYILPGDTRYVAELGIPTDNNVAPASVNFSISNVVPANLTAVSKPQFTVFNKLFGPSQTASSGNEATGVLQNESLYDLNSVNVVAVLRDSQNKIIGIGMTTLDTVRSKEERSLYFQWPYALSGDVQSIDMDPQTDVFDSSDLLQ